jgi:hypothetical protein
VLTASLSAPSTKTVKVDYKTANGTAVAGSDYNAVSGTLTFAPGQTRTTFGVLAHGDTQAEADETFSVRLTNARNATIADGTGVITLRDDGDGLPQINISDASAVEGDVLTFIVTLSKPSTQAVTVDYGWGTLTFAPGETSKSISIATRDDSVPEPQSYSVTLFNASPNALILDGEGVGAVYDDEPPPFVGALYDPVSGTWYNPSAQDPYPQDYSWTL